MTTLSIVVPAYNAEASIERTVNSVLQQDDDRWQLIVVDDGSTDGTASILRSLADDDRIHLVLLDENVGLAGARNAGLEHVNGEWFTFLDADDEFAPNRVSAGLAAVSDDVDIVCCRHTIVQMDERTRMRGIDDERVISGEEFALGLLTEHYPSYSWDKMFRTATLGDLRFVHVIRAEDQVHSIKAALQARKVRFIADALIAYQVSATSLTWGRTTSADENRALLAALEDAAAPLLDSDAGRRAMRTARTLDYLAIAHQAIFNDAAMPSRGYSWRDVAATITTQPFFGVAAAFFKAAPALYARVYSRYATLLYGLRR